jgi:hypothetical protein
MCCRRTSWALRGRSLAVSLQPGGCGLGRRENARARNAQARRAHDAAPFGFGCGVVHVSLAHGSACVVGTTGCGWIHAAQEKMRRRPRRERWGRR